MDYEGVDQLKYTLIMPSCDLTCESELHLYFVVASNFFLLSLINMLEIAERSWRSISFPFLEALPPTLQIGICGL